MQPIILPEMSDPVSPKEYIIESDSKKGYRILLEINSKKIEVVSWQVRHKYALTELLLLLIKQNEGKQFFIHHNKLLTGD